VTPSPLAPLRRAALGVLVALAALALAALAVAAPAPADPVATCSASPATAHPGQATTIYARCSPSTAVPASVQIDPPAHGTVVALSNLTFRYAADGAFTGPVTFTVHPSGGDGQAWPAFTVAVDVSATANTPPNCGYGPSATTRQGSAVIVALPACIDAEGDPTTVAISTAPTHGGVSAVRATGSAFEVTYTPDPGYAGADSFAYAATDDHGGRSGEVTVPVDVRPLGFNSAPICTPTISFPLAGPGFVTVFADRTTFPLWCSDADGDPLTVAFVALPAHGTVVAGSGASGPTFTYTPTGGYTGLDSFAVEVSDGQGGTVRKNVLLHVGNHWAECGTRISASVASRVVAEDPGVTVHQPCTDPDGDPLTAQLWTPPEHGTASYDQASGTVTYTPDIGFVGEDVVGYEVDDGHFGGNYFSVGIHVGPAAPHPVAPAAGPAAPVARDAAATRAAAVLGKSFVALDLGLGAAVRAFATGAKTVADGRPVVVVVCAKACTVGVDGQLKLAGERGGARSGSLKLVHRALRAKAGRSAVVRLALTKAQRTRVAHAKKAVVTLALSTRTAGRRARLVHRAFTVRSP